MKIIGKTNGGYLVAMSNLEVAQISGFSYENSADYLDFLRKQSAADRAGLMIGAEIPVSASWDRLATIRRKEVELRKAAETMRGLADLVDGAWPAIVAEMPIDLSGGAS